MPRFACVECNKKFDSEGAIGCTRQISTAANVSFL